MIVASWWSCYKTEYSLKMLQPETPLPAYQGDGLYLSEALKSREQIDRMSPKNRWRVLGGLGVCFAGLSAAAAFGLSIAHQENDGGERHAAGLQPAAHKTEVQTSSEGYVDTLYGRQKVLVISTGQEPSTETTNEGTWSADATTLVTASIGGATALMFAAGAAEHIISARRNKADAPLVRNIRTGTASQSPKQT
jgi:hypothetical protein